MSEQQTIIIEVDGRELQALPGQMLIEVTDAAGIDIPRFCYHKKLSVAANCRMCLVEVEKAPKPLPACATPVAAGMKVHTRSPLARAAQQGTMEFLLINHPLDCPICDQGGECELQDVAMGYGGDASRFSERKRVVRDEDIGPLVATDMTRCIHCTRCVRFGAEIAGVRELGATGRGEHMRIGVYVQHTMSSELSGNVIDLCPVGALTSKPFRFSARAWELTQRPGIAGHDLLGSNINLHLRRGKVMRVAPRENEALNETWLSDRDRFSYQGLYSGDRIQVPLVRTDKGLRPVGWQEALLTAAQILKAAKPERLGLLASPNATLEELYLGQRLLRGLGSNNIDHRLRQCDFRAATADPRLPWLGSKVAELAGNDLTLLVGSALRKEQPLLNLRVRQSTKRGGRVMAINPIHFDFNYELAEEAVVAPSAMLQTLAGVAAALGADTAGIQAKPDAQQKRIAAALKAADKGTVLLGGIGQMHPDYTLLRQLAANIAAKAGLSWGTSLDGANATGAWMAGAVPHRAAGGSDSAQSGLSLADMLQQGLEATVLLGVEPDFDSAEPAALRRLLEQSKVIALSTHLSPWLEECADLVLPIAATAETSGTLVNGQGDLQSFQGAAPPPGEARPAWKVLRVLGGMVDLAGFEYDDSTQVRDELLAQCEGVQPDNSLGTTAELSPVLTASDDLERVSGVPIYAQDALVRRATALQQSADAWRPGVRVCSDLAARIRADAGQSVVIRQNGDAVTLPLWVDDRVPKGLVWLPLGVPGSELLGKGFGPVSLEKA